MMIALKYYMVNKIKSQHAPIHFFEKADEKNHEKSLYST